MVLKFSTRVAEPTFRFRHWTTILSDVATRFFKASLSSSNSPIRGVRWLSDTTPRPACRAHNAATSSVYFRTFPPSGRNLRNRLITFMSVTFKLPTKSITVSTQTILVLNDVLTRSGKLNFRTGNNATSLAKTAVNKRRHFGRTTTRSASLSTSRTSFLPIISEITIYFVLLRPNSCTSHAVFPRHIHTRMTSLALDYLIDRRIETTNNQLTQMISLPSFLSYMVTIDQNLTCRYHVQ